MVWSLIVDILDAMPITAFRCSSASAVPFLTGTDCGGISAGERITNQGVKSWVFSLTDTEISGCNFTNFTDRCAYPDVYSHTFNATLTYSCPTLLSYPHFYKVHIKSYHHLQHLVGVCMYDTKPTQKSSISRALETSA